MPEASSIALLIETSMAHGRDLLRGIVQYVRAHDLDWRMHLEPGDGTLPAAFRRWRVDGVIARARRTEVLRAIYRRDVPRVVLPGPAERPATPLVRPSGYVMMHAFHNYATGEVGARHFLERGFRHFGFCGLPGVGAFDRDVGFARAVEAVGFTCTTYPHGLQGTPRRDWGRERKLLATWLRSLPKPVGVMAANDGRGRQVVEAAHLAGLRVPWDVAVLGVDNDEVICECCMPPLSSVALPVVRLGERAAAVLHEMLQGRTFEPPPPLSPLDVVTRASTDLLAVDDPEVAVAVRFIREHATDPIDVADVLRAVNLARRTLETRMRRAIGCSPREQIERTRVERARTLLRDTDLPMPDVAERCGYSNAPRLCEAFGRVTGTSPAAYRRQSRGN